MREKIVRDPVVRDHIVYVDEKSGVLEKLLDGSKRMLIRDGHDHKPPYRDVRAGDDIYFIPNNASDKVRAMARVKEVLDTEKLSLTDSQALLHKHKAALQLNDAQLWEWAGLECAVLVAVENVQPVSPFQIDRSHFGHFDDWLVVDSIDAIRQKPSIKAISTGTP